jgi:hypothetical protein
MLLKTLKCSYYYSGISGTIPGFWRPAKISGIGEAKLVRDTDERGHDATTIRHHNNNNNKSDIDPQFGKGLTLVSNVTNIDNKVRIFYRLC